MNNQKSVWVKAVSLIALIALASLSMSFAQDTSEEEDMTETNKELTLRFFEEGWSNGDVSVIDELVSPDMVDHNNELPEGVTAFEFLTMNVSMFKGAVPDLEMAVINMVAEGDTVAVFTLITGTHEGDFMGMPATGNAISVDNVDFFRFEDGQIVERWGVGDTLAFMTQFGLMSPAQ